MRTLAWSAVLLCITLIGCQNPPRRDAPSKWTRVQNVSAQTVVMEYTDGKGVATYYFVSPGAPLETRAAGPARLRLYLSPEFRDAAAPPADTGVTVSISGSPDRTIVAHSMPAAARRYLNGQGAGVPGKVHTAFLDVPAGEHAVRISADGRVAVQLYLGK